MRRRAPAWLAVLFVALSVAVAARPGTPSGEKRVIAYGKADGAAPGWAISAPVPSGWTSDCCDYAQAIGVNAVLYHGTWTGKPERVMVLNVWPRKLPTLAAEWRADRKHYLGLDPRAKVTAFPVGNPSMPCHGLLYQGTDHLDDAVVFCDPGKVAGVRYSWSMTVAANDPQRKQLLARFRQLVGKSRYMVYTHAEGTAHASGTH